MDVLEGLDVRPTVRHKGSSSLAKRRQPIRYSSGTATELPKVSCPALVPTRLQAKPYPAFIEVGHVASSLFKGSLVDVDGGDCRICDELGSRHLLQSAHSMQPQVGG